MKRLLIVGSILLWLGYITATAFLSVFAGPRNDSGLGVLLTSGSTLAVVSTLLVVAQLLANPADAATEAGRRYYRRLAWVFIGGLVASILVTVIGAILRQAPPWVPTAMIALTVLCSVGPVAAAEHHRRRLRDAEVRPGGIRFGVDDRRRTFLRSGITFAIATTVVAAVLAVLSGTTDFGDPSVVEILGFSLGVGAILAGVPTLAAAWRLTKSTNLIFGTDIESRTVVTLVVLRGRSKELTTDQEQMATEFAHVWREYLPIQLAQSALIIAGMVLINSPRLFSGDIELWLVVVYVLLGVGLMLGIISGRRQYRRLRQYSEQHPVEAPA